jgi:lipid intermediate transporter
VREICQEFVFNVSWKHSSDNLCAYSFLFPSISVQSATLVFPAHCPFHCALFCLFQKSCGAVADKYIEFELIIIILDLVLHKPQAYRHLLFNRFRQRKVRSMVFPPSIHSAIHSAIRSYSAHSPLLDESQVVVSAMIIAYIALEVFLKWMNVRYNCPPGQWPFVGEWDGIVRPIQFIVEAAIEQSSVIVGVGSFCRLLRSRHRFSWKKTSMALVIANSGKLGYLLIVLWNYPLYFSVISNIFVTSCMVVAVSGKCIHSRQFNKTSSRHLAPLCSPSISLFSCWIMWIAVALRLPLVYSIFAVSIGVFSRFGMRTFFCYFQEIIRHESFCVGVLWRIF